MKTDAAEAKTSVSVDASVVHNRLRLNSNWDGLRNGNDGRRTANGHSNGLSDRDCLRNGDGVRSLDWDRTGNWCLHGDLHRARLSNRDLVRDLNRDGLSNRECLWHGHGNRVRLSNRHVNRDADLHWEALFNWHTDVLGEGLLHGYADGHGDYLRHRDGHLHRVLHRVRNGDAHALNLWDGVRNLDRDGDLHRVRALHRHADDLDYLERNLVGHRHGHLNGDLDDDLDVVWHRNSDLVRHVIFDDDLVRGRHADLDWDSDRYGDLHELLHGHGHGNFVWLLNRHPLVDGVGLGNWDGHSNLRAWDSDLLGRCLDNRAGHGHSGTLNRNLFIDSTTTDSSRLVAHGEAAVEATTETTAVDASDTDTASGECATVGAVNSDTTTADDGG